MSRLIGVAILLMVLGIAAGLAVCAIPRVRDAAARAQCQNNLKEIVIALHNRHAACGTFPSATIPNENLSCSNRLSWLVEVPPYWTQIRLVIDREKGWQDKANIIPKITDTHSAFLKKPPTVLGELKLFRCPADSTASPADAASLTNYVGISGVGRDAAEKQLGYPGVGFFGCQRQIKIADIKDGLANTIAVMETNQDIGPWTAGGFSTVRPFDPAKVPYLGAGRPFGSGHRGVTQAAFADGSVHSFTTSIQPEVLEALATIAGGEKTAPLDD